LLCLAATLAIAAVSCDRGEGDEPDSIVLSEDEKYLIDAYVDVNRARSHYPRYPAVAESLFTVLESTIDSDRIAITIRAVNQDPERWVAIFEEIERRLKRERETPDQRKVRRPSRRSKKPRG
jgi:hypothetical protein